jgi:hypothetical protein
MLFKGFPLKVLQIGERGLIYLYVVAHLYFINKYDTVMNHLTVYSDT